MPPSRTYPVVVIHAEKPPSLHINVSTVDAPKTAKSVFLPYAGDSKCAACFDANDVSIGTLYWRDNKNYGINTTAAKLIGDRFTIYGSAVLVGLPKTKARPSSLTPEVLAFIGNLYNTEKGIDPVAFSGSRSSSNKHPPKARSALDFFLLQQKKEARTGKEEYAADVAIGKWNQLQNKSAYEKMEAADLVRFESATNEWTERNADTLTKPVGPRTNFVLWSMAHPEIPKATKHEEWKLAEKTEWTQRAEADRERYKREMEAYQEKCSEFKLFKQSKKADPVVAQPAKRQKTEPEARKSSIKPPVLEQESASEESSSETDADEEEQD